MSLNPIQFGEHVVEQFHRYLMTYFPIADARMEAQVREHLKRGPGRERKLVRGPFIHLNRPFEPGPMLRDLQEELRLHPALPGLFRFEQLYKHQELALRAILNGRHTVMATATGSGKTEGFLIPILDQCLRMRDDGAAAGVIAVLVYPMNALVNDQTERLRVLLAGTGITFARYTGETPNTTPDNVRRLTQSRRYTPDELAARQERNKELPRPWEEALSRQEIVERRPRLLLTNYRQLEFMLLRDRDLDLLRDAPLRFMVFDEVHTYTGALGSEVACLIRRLRHVAGKQPGEVVCIGTSATVQDDVSELDGPALTREFAHRLFGVPEDRIEVVTEQYREPEIVPGEMYKPPRPADAKAMLDEVLQAARHVQLQDEVTEVPASLLAVAEKLCGREAPPDPSPGARMYGLLSANQIVRELTRVLATPLPLVDLLKRLRNVGDRGDASDEGLTAEALSYLTLGAICEHDDEPLLRPKLHYFVQGYPGLWVSFEPEGRPTDPSGELTPVVHFEGEPRGEDSSEGLRLPLMLCRGCGQHYFRALGQEVWAAEDDNAYMPLRAGDPWEQPGKGEFECYVTDRLHTQDEDFDADVELWHMCRFCGAAHRAPAERCARDGCRRSGPMVAVRIFQEALKRCAACGAIGTISGTRSAEVADVHALAETMLSAMGEPSLRKLLIFSDNRQDAAFQAGWMQERSRRHELRQILCQLLNEDTNGARTIEKVSEQMLDRAQQERVVEVNSHADLENEHAKIKWFLLQEFASRAERRGRFWQRHSRGTSGATSGAPAAMAGRRASTCPSHRSSPGSTVWRASTPRPSSANW